MDLKITHLSTPTWQPQAHERWTPHSQPTIHCTPTIVSEVLLTELCDVKSPGLRILNAIKTFTYFSYFFLNIFFERRLKK